MSRPFRRPTRRLPWILTALLLLLGTGTAAYAFWASTTSSSNAAAAADTLTPGSKPTVTASNTALTVTWAGGTTANGRAATGYTVTRYAAATGGTGTPATGGCAGTVTTLSCTEQGVPGGIWYYTVTPTIALWTGAESPCSTGTSNDTSAPTASATLSPTPNTAGWNNTSPVTVNVTADDGTGGSGVASISYAVDGGAQQTVNGAVAAIPVTGDGTHTVSYFATDKVGNAGLAQSQPVRIDTQAPAAPGLTVPAYVNLANVSSVPVSGTAEAGATITLAASDGAGRSAPVTVTASGTGAWSANLDLRSLNQGTITYSATATDAAGNTSATRSATNIKDTVAPGPAQGLLVPAYVNSGNVSGVPVSGTAEAGTTATVTATSAGSATPVTATATASGTGAWSLNLDLGPLKDGTVTYSATIADAAGNTSSAVTATDTKDTVAPVLTITAPMYVNSSSNVAAVPVSGTTDAGTAVNVTVRNGVSQSVTKQVTPTGTSWSTTMDLSNMADGTLTYTAAATDAAGNTGSATASGTTSKDVAAPSVSSITLTNGGVDGKADTGDTLSIQFSEQIDASKICSNWARTGAQTLSGNNNVTVTINTSNVLTVSSTSCSLNLGTIALGSNARYASTAALSFTGNGNASNMSTVSWDGTATLTIKLGKSAGGSSGTTSTADTPTYTAAAGLTDLAGNPLGTVPVTVGLPSRF